MKRIIRYIGAQRFNTVDMVGFAATLAIYHNYSFPAAVVAAIVAGFLAVLAERASEKYQ